MQSSGDVLVNLFAKHATNSFLSWYDSLRFAFSLFGNTLSEISLTFTVYVTMIYRPESLRAFMESYSRTSLPPVLSLNIQAYTWQHELTTPYYIRSNSPQFQIWWLWMRSSTAEHRHSAHIFLVLARKYQKKRCVANDGEWVRCSQVYLHQVRALETAIFCWKKEHEIFPVKL